MADEITQAPEALTDDTPGAALPPNVVFSIRVDAEGVVSGTVQSNCEQPGATVVTESVYEMARPLIGRVKFDGTTLTPYEPPMADPRPPSVPESVTRLQGRLALSRANLLGPAESAITAAGGETAIWYADAQTWRRDDPHIAAIAGSLRLTSDEVDALFITAAQIV